MAGVLTHYNSELVNRRPVVVSFIQKRKTGIKNGRQANATRLGKLLVKKLERMGW